MQEFSQIPAFWEGSADDNFKSKAIQYEAQQIISHNIGHDICGHAVLLAEIR
jgi:hypothetical protein